MACFYTITEKVFWLLVIIFIPSVFITLTETISCAFNALTNPDEYFGIHWNEKRFLSIVEPMGLWLGLYVEIDILKKIRKNYAFQYASDLYRLIIIAFLSPSPIGQPISSLAEFFPWISLILFSIILVYLRISIYLQNRAISLQLPKPHASKI